MAGTGGARSVVGGVGPHFVNGRASGVKRPTSAFTSISVVSG